jgi:hypothetical protein
MSKPKQVTLILSDEDIELLAEAVSESDSWYGTKTGDIVAEREHHETHRKMYDILERLGDAYMAAKS